MDSFSLRSGLGLVKMKKSRKEEPPPKKKFNMFNYFPTVSSNETTSTEDSKKG